MKSPIHFIRHETVRKEIYFIILMIIFGAFFLILRQTFIGGVTFMVVLCLFTMVLIKLRLNDRAIFYMMFFSFLCKLMLVAVNNFLFSWGKVDDARRFESAAWELALSWHTNEPLHYFSGTYFYAEIVAFFYYYFGREQVIPELFNVFLSIIIILNVYRVALLIFENRAASRMAALLISFYPTHLNYSVVMLRENLIVMFFTFYGLFLIKFIKTGKYRYIVFSVIMIYLASLTHGAMILMAFAIPIVIIFTSGKVKFSRIIIGIVALYLIMTIIELAGVSKISSNLLEMLNPEDLTNSREKAARNRTAYLQGIQLNSLLDMVIYTPLFVFYFLLTPFPWQVREIIDILGFIDSIAIFIFVVSGVLVFKRCKNKQQRKMLVACFVVIVFGVLVFSVGTSNYGTAIRHRGKFIWLLCVLASPYINSLFQQYIFRIKKIILQNRSG